MSQIIIMEFLDKHPGKFYTGRELKNVFKNDFNTVTLYRKLKQIIKREEYCCIITHRPNKRKLTAVYGREE